MVVTGCYTLATRKFALDVLWSRTGKDRHSVANCQCAKVILAGHAAKGTAVLYGYAATGTSLYEATVHFHIGTFGILAGTNTGTPSTTVGKYTAAIDHHCAAVDAILAFVLAAANASSILATTGIDVAAVNIYLAAVTILGTADAGTVSATISLHLTF